MINSSLKGETNRLSKDDEAFFESLKELSDEARGKLLEAVKATEAAYRCPPELRTEEQAERVMQHELWKTKNRRTHGSH